jgi:hypothetical protein
MAVKAGQKMVFGKGSEGIRKVGNVLILSSLLHFASNTTPHRGRVRKLLIDLETGV